MTITAGYLPTPEGEAALERAVLEARATGVPLLVVTSSQNPAKDEGFSLEQEFDALGLRLEKAGLEYEIVQHDGTSDPADAIIGAAERSGSDLIVIGIRRRSAVGKLLLGSTAQRVLLEANCAVLAVKPVA